MSSRRASSRWSRQPRSSGSSARCSAVGQVGAVGVGRLEQHVEVADRAQPRGDLAEALAVGLRPARLGTPRRRRATRRAAAGSRRASRGAPRRSLPSRVPASRASIRARWKRRTLRPASATWSSARTPGVLPTTRRGAASASRACGGRPLRSAASGAGSAPGVGSRSGSSPGSAPPAVRPRRRSPGSGAARRRVAAGLSAGPSGRLDVRLASSARNAAARLPRLPGRRLDRRQRRLELRTRRRRRGPGRRRGSASSALERGLVALDQLDLELDEPLDDPAPGDDIDLVEAQLDDRVADWSFRLRRSWRIVTTSTSGASPHCSRISERASDGGQSRGPAVRSAGPSSSSRRWAPDRRRSPAERLDRHGRALRRLAQPGREPGPGEGAVGGVEVAVLELGRADRRDRR